MANMEIWGSKCATYHHHLEVIFYFLSLSSLHLFPHHRLSDCGQKAKLLSWFNDPDPWRVRTAEPGTRICLNSVFDGISPYETGTERTLSDTLETQNLRFLLRCFCCCCKTFTFCFLTRLKFKSNSLDGYFWSFKDTTVIRDEQTPAVWRERTLIRKRRMSMTEAIYVITNKSWRELWSKDTNQRSNAVSSTCIHWVQEEQTNILLCVYLCLCSI